MAATTQHDGSVGRLREARPSDGDALLALTRACPMEADVALLIERAPDFFALCEARGRSRVLVVEEDGEVVACASAARRVCRLGGQAAPMGVLADAKVRPDRRRQGLAERLLDALAEGEADASPAPYVGLTAAGNSAVDSLLLRFGTGRPLRSLATLESFQLFPILPLRVPRGLDIHPAGPGDRDELVALLDRFHRRYELAPVFEDGGFEEVLGRSPGMELGDYLLAHRRGRLVAALGVWDQHDVKRTRVLGMPRRLRAFTTAVRGGARVLPLPRLPAVGETLDFRYARHAAHEPGHERALRALVRSAVNAVRRRGEHFLLFTCAQGDPIVSVLRRIPRSSYRYRVVAGANRPEAEVILDRLCGALIYDDAALS